MKVDLSKMLKDFKGVVLKDRPGEGAEDLTVGIVLIDALLRDHPHRKESKRTRYILAHKLFGVEGEVEISTKDAAMLLEVVGPNYPTIIVGQIAEVLDPKENENE